MQSVIVGTKKVNEDYLQIGQNNRPLTEPVGSRANLEGFALIGSDGGRESA